MDIINIIISTLSILGSAASIYGIYLTYKQVEATKKEAEATKTIAEAAKEAAEQTQKDIHKTISTIEIAKYCEIITRIQEILEGENIHFALHLCEELHESLMEILEFEKTILKKGQSELQEYVDALSNNITFIRLSLFEKKGKLNKKKIITDLTKLHEIMLKVKTEYKINP